MVPCVKLTHRFRNAGAIADAAYEILNGNVPEAYDDSFEFRECADMDEVRSCCADNMSTMQRRERMYS